MKTETVDKLLTLALDARTPFGEATAAMTRLLASADAREHARDRMADACTACDHNRSELRRAIATIARLRADISRLTEQLASENIESPRPTPSATPRPRGRYRRGPRPVVALETPARCADDSCGAALAVGDPVRVYPGGRVYGTECHGRRAS